MSSTTLTATASGTGNEPGIAKIPQVPEQAVNLRWRDGTLYQSVPTDGEGFVPFDQVFPFFSWLVAEVDFLALQGHRCDGRRGRRRPDSDFDDPWTFGGQLNPQPRAIRPILTSITTPIITS